MQRLFLEPPHERGTGRVRTQMALDEDTLVVWTFSGQISAQNVGIQWRHW
jgi:hypothetical protein